MIKAPVVLPPNRAWNEPNTGDIFGSIFQTQNISLDVPGIISLSKRSILLRKEDTATADMKYLLSSQFDGQGLTGAVKYYELTSGKLYRMDQDLSDVEVDPTSSQPSFGLFSDAVMWIDGLYCSTTSNVSKLSASAWTGSQMSFTNAGITHPLAVSASANYLMGGDGNLLRIKDPSSGTVTTALTLPANYRIQWIRSDYTRTLIGCRNMNGGNTAVFEWDEVSPTWTNKFDVDAAWAYSGVFRNTDFFIIVNDGRLQKFNGGGFSTVGQFPIYKTLQGYWTNSFSLSTVFQRGMIVQGGRVNILVSGDIDGTTFVYPNFQSGIWEFDESTGLNHKYGLTFGDDDTDFNQGVFSAGAGALGGIVVDPVDGGPDPETGGVLIWGGRLDGGRGTEYYVLGSIQSDGVNRGSFVTTHIETSDIADDAKKLWVKFRGLYTDEDKLLFKRKQKDRVGLPFCTTTFVTWTSDTEFTCPDTVFQYAEVGDEVTNLSGRGAGAAAHITGMNLFGGEYTVMLDEVIPGIVAGDRSDVNVDNFERLDTEALDTTDETWIGVPMQQTTPSDWVMVKTEMRGAYTVTIDEMQLVTSSHVTPTP